MFGRDYMKEKFKVISVMGSIVGFVIILLAVGWYLWYMFIKPEPQNIEITSVDEKVKFVLATDIKSTSSLKEDNNDLITKIEYNVVQYSDFIEETILPHENLVRTYIRNNHNCYLFLYEGYQFTLEHIKNRKFVLSNNGISCEVSYNEESYDQLVLPFFLNEQGKEMDTFGENNYKFEYEGYYDSFDRILEYYENDVSGCSRVSYNQSYIYLYGIIRNGNNIKKTKEVVARIYDAGDYFILDCSRDFEILESM